MIDFKEELKEFKPLLEMEDIEESITDDGFNDLLDILSHISLQNYNIFNKK